MTAFSAVGDLAVTMTCIAFMYGKSVRSSYEIKQIDHMSFHPLKTHFSFLKTRFFFQISRQREVGRCQLGRRATCLGAASFATMSANDNKIVPSDQSRSPASEDHDTRVATRAYAVRHGDTTLEHLSSERGLDYDEVLRLNPAVSARNGLLKAGDVLKLPKQGASGPKRADGVDGAAQSPGPSTAPSSADDANAPAVVDARIVGEADPAGDAPRGDSRDDGADDTGDPAQVLEYKFLKSLLQKKHRLFFSCPMTN